MTNLIHDKEFWYENISSEFGKTIIDTTFFNKTNFEFPVDEVFDIKKISGLDEERYYVRFFEEKYNCWYYKEGCYPRYLKDYNFVYWNPERECYDVFKKNENFGFEGRKDSHHYVILDKRGKDNIREQIEKYKKFLFAKHENINAKN